MDSFRSCPLETRRSHANANKTRGRGRGGGEEAEKNYFDHSVSDSVDDACE
jgi:hypothetical protein